MPASSRSRTLPAIQFVGRVVRDFRKNQGFLLASGVAYNTLLSIVPLFAVLLVVFSEFTDEKSLLATVASYVELLLPGSSAAVMNQVSSLLAHREAIAGIGGLALLFFSSIAFTVLEGAMSVIFFHRSVHRRHFLLSAIIPYLFILALGTGLLLVSIITGALRVVGRDTLWLFGRQWELGGLSRAILWFLGVAGLALLITALYMVLPVGRLSFRHALAGGVTATVLWEIVRRILAWYFATISMVNVVYGSLASTIGVLLTLEAAALVLLIGAQVIAELERSRKKR
ncbi:MAG: YihY/virulence factor BrkB family protein [Acidobacteria bacterium]|nr:YihY/virulence factor BrkB family protein [Acidobacteriota bacterium]